MTSFKAFDKRTKTLLVEYKNQFKANKFTDKRIGENDQTLTLEDKMFKRFVAERQKPRDKKNKKFNLNDEDDDNGFGGGGLDNELTHMGQSIAQMENFERVQASDDDENYDDPNDKDKGRISAKIVSENFFGGFTQNNKQKEKEEQELKSKNKKEWVDEMILKSKQIKYERQKEKDKTLDLTEQLDKEWRNIIPLIGKMVNKNKQNEEEEAEKLRVASEENKNVNLLTSKASTTAKDPEDYDYLVKSLQFEGQKAQPSNKLKTEKELEQERVDSLQKSEKDLIDRMHNEVPDDKDQDQENDKNKHKNKKTTTNAPLGLKKIPLNHYSVDDMEFNEPEYLQAINKNEIKQKFMEETRQEYDDSKKSTNTNDEDDQEEDYEDLSESNTDTHSIAESFSSHLTEFSEFSQDKWLGQFKGACIKLAKNSIDPRQFEKVVRSLILRLDPGKDEKNKQRLCLLVQHLIEFYQSLFKPKPKVDLKVDFTLVEVLKGFVYELTFKHGNKSTKKEPSMYVELFKRILTNINADYDAGKIADKKFPDLSVLFTFKLVSTVFPVSDFRHQISTPCLLIMTRYLTECATQTVGDCLRGSFLCNLCFEFISLSKRFIPECIQYLNGVLYLSIDWKKEEHLKQYDLSTIYESFKKSQLKLLVSKKLDKLGQVNLIQTSSNEASQMSDSSLSASLIAYNLDLILAFAKIYDGHVSYREVFHLTNVLLNLLPKQSYPAELTDRIQKLQLTIAASTQQPREFLKCLIKKPFATKMIDPRVQTKSKFDPKHHNSVISEKQLDARKYKKEMKSAIKEIRQDNQYLARVQLQEQLEKDKKRSAKVKEIMGSLASQEGEYQKAKRMKS